MLQDGVIVDDVERALRRCFFAAIASHTSALIISGVSVLGRLCCATIDGIIASIRS